MTWGEVLDKYLKLIKLFTLCFVVLYLPACTSGYLEYVTPEGETKVACRTEYTWQPSVDKYAVEYILSYCAKRAVEEGNSVVDRRLLGLDLTLPKPPEGKAWSYELAKQLHRRGALVNKEYGYLIAALDLGHLDN